jgi:hypothetical protein
VLVGKQHRIAEARQVRDAAAEGTTSPAKLISSRPGDWASPSAAGMGALTALMTPITAAAGVTILTSAPIWTRTFSAMAS